MCESKPKITDEQFEKMVLKAKEDLTKNNNAFTSSNGSNNVVNKQNDKDKMNTDKNDQEKNDLKENNENEKKENLSELKELLDCTEESKKDEVIIPDEKKEDIQNEKNNELKTEDKMEESFDEKDVSEKV